jgi:adenine-specific DNA-methyltransferase
VAEQWGRRWITIDTSRVALALARSRIMGARYPFYLLADSEDGYRKELELGGMYITAENAEITEKLQEKQNKTSASSAPSAVKNFYNRLRHGFVYERVPHITLKSIANNAEIDVIWEQYQPKIEAALTALNAALNTYRKSPFRVEAGARQGMDLHFGIPDRESEYMALPSGERAASFALLEWEVPRMVSLD